MIVAGSASPLLLSSAGGYNLTKSLRFRSSASAYLSRTPSSTGNRKTFTISYWMKRGTLGTTQYLFAAGSGTTESTWFQGGAFDTNGSSFDATSLGTWTTGGGQTTALFRDPSAWYHFVWAIDTTQATASNRVKLWVNGVQQTLSTPTITQNADLAWNNAGVVHYIGARIDSGPRSFFDGYLTEIYNIDGQALTPSSFGQTSPTTGVWQPKRYTGTYGTNGFYLPFTNTTSTSTLGNDFSGNNNTWTVNNISLTSGSTYDSMNDVPTLTNATTANYAVLNPINVDPANPSGTITNGNLSVSNTTLQALPYSTIGFTTGKYYFEFILTALPSTATSFIGVCTSPYAASNLRAYRYDTGQYFNGTTWVSYGATWTTNDVIGTAIDMTNQTIEFYKNGTSQGQITSLNLTGLNIFPMFYMNSNNAAGSINFGQRPFAYTPPTGFVALNTFNLPTPTIGATASTQADDYFDATLYTGNSSTQSITNSGSMQPDMVWIKARNTTYNHGIQDAVRGVGKIIYPNLTNAEDTGSTSLTAFNSNGFGLGNDSWNQSTINYVAWQWRASNATAVTNTAGSITSTVSANTTAGFSIVTYTGNGSNATIGHGLGVAPSMIIRKARNASAQNNWYVYHQSLSANGAVFLNLTDAYFATSSYWNNTAPTSTVFTVGSATNVLNDTWVAYCFAQVAGYSAFGSYTGNGSSDGPFVFTGFRPRFFMIKRTDTTTNWIMYDTARQPYNTTNPGPIYANLSSAEESNTTLTAFDILSNGFKPRNTSSWAESNASGGTYIYMAFAESPFKYANAR